MAAFHAHSFYRLQLRLHHASKGKKKGFKQCPATSTPRQMFYTHPIKVFSPKIRKLKAQHHKEENQSRTGFGAAIKQLAANPRCTFKCKYSGKQKNKLESHRRLPSHSQAESKPRLLRNLRLHLHTAGDNLRAELETKQVFISN